MSEFLKLLTPGEALDKFITRLSKKNLPELIIPTEESLGWILADDIYSPHPLPNYSRSTVDGYAVYSSETFGASNNLPTYLNIIGEVMMGQNIEIPIKNGQSILIHTGGMVPPGADSVVMIEDTQRMGDEVEIRKSTAAGENIISLGEEILTGALFLSSGTKIRSIEIGGLKALGINLVQVRSKPKVGIISSGDEIIKPEGKLLPGKVRDANSYLLSSLITSWGGQPLIYGIVRDDLEDLIRLAERAIKECDLLIFTAGSSVSVRDITSTAIRSLGAPGIIVHGVNIRPGKPTILAVCSEKAVFGLPGNPVSAYVTANLFVKPTIEYYLNVKTEFTPTIKAELITNLPSQAGREDWVPVKLEEKSKRVSAIPIFSKSNFIVSLSTANGMICIPAESTGLEAGEMVNVFECY